MNAFRTDIRPSRVVVSTFDPLTGRGYLARRGVLGLLGPAFVAAVAFVDPGNIATNTSAGAEYGYLLVWTVVSASAMAMVVQYLSAKLGMATGASLAEVCRDNTRTPVRLGLWLVAELVVVMTDLAELVGGALALNLLLGLPLVLGGAIVLVLTVGVLQLRVRGREGFPAVIVGLLVLLGLAFVYLVVRAPFDLKGAVGGFVPRLGDSQSALLACGIVGATIMPHAVFLHSSLTGGLGGEGRSVGTPVVLRFLRRDVVIAMGVAGVVNVLMLLVATSLPAGMGDSLTAAHTAFAEQRGAVFATVFALALLASGLASACAGVYSGQAVMQGFLRRTSSIWVRRAVTAVPALAILAVVTEPTQALVLSQVGLSFGLPFALVPLLMFTARRDVMGSFVNRKATTVVGAIITAMIVVLNAYVLSQVLGTS